MRSPLILDGANNKYYSLIMKMEIRIKHLRRLAKEKEVILQKMDAQEAKDDPFTMEQLRMDLESNRDEVGYYRECA